MPRSGGLGPGLGDVPAGEGAAAGVQDLALAGIAHPVTIEVNDVHTLLALVSHDLGIALVPDRIAAKKGDHVAVPLAVGAAGHWQVSVAVPSGSAASLAADALIGMLPTNRSLS
ncbi:MAG: hypothetical protein QOG10_4709 [Kribbellaceae bacterium]|nr:hypothetical protein [Kribbellaceae bacterium]